MNSCQAVSARGWNNSTGLLLPSYANTVKTSLIMVLVMVFISYYTPPPPPPPKKKIV